MCDLVDEFTPEKYNEHTSPRNFRVMVHNDHAYLLNDKIKELEQKKFQVNLFQLKEFQTD